LIIASLCTGGTCAVVTDVVDANGNVIHKNGTYCGKPCVQPNDPPNTPLTQQHKCDCGGPTHDDHQPA
jgi:hypothetical protein